MCANYDTCDTVCHDKVCTLKEETNIYPLRLIAALVGKLYFALGLCSIYILLTVLPAYAEGETTPSTTSSTEASPTPSPTAEPSPATSAPQTSSTSSGAEATPTPTAEPTPSSSSPSAPSPTSEPQSSPSPTSSPTPTETSSSPTPEPSVSTAPTSTASPEQSPSPSSTEQTPTPTPIPETPTVTSVQAKIESATVTLNTAVEAASPAQQSAAAVPVAEAQTAITTAESATAVAVTAQAAVDSQTAVVATAASNVTTAQGQLATLQDAPNNTKVFTTEGYTAPVAPETPTVTTTTLPTMYDAATKIQTPFDIKMGDTVYNGQGPSSQIYVTSKATITFGTGDYNWWDFPNAPNISVFASDYQNAGPGASTVVTTTETTLEVDWNLHRFGDSNGPITNVNWKMTVNPDTGEWTGIGKISGNTTNLWNGPRTGVREAAGEAVQPMTAVTPETIAAANRSNHSSD